MSQFVDFDTTGETVRTTEMEEQLQEYNDTYDDVDPQYDKYVHMLEKRCHDLTSEICDLVCRIPKLEDQKLEFDEYIAKLTTELDKTK
jgi:prefoldin subunit 5